MVSSMISKFFITKHDNSETHHKKNGSYYSLGKVYDKKKYLADLGQIDSMFYIKMWEREDMYCRDSTRLRR